MIKFTEQASRLLNDYEKQEAVENIELQTLDYAKEFIAVVDIDEEGFNLVNIKIYKLDTSHWYIV